jgi:hypothetical protein
MVKVPCFDNALVIGTATGQIPNPSLKWGTIAKQILDWI